MTDENLRYGYEHLYNIRDQTILFEYEPFPRDREEYLRWIQCNLDFVEKRNARIASFIDQV